MKLEAGMLIKTNYSGPYRIVSISRDCTCSGRHQDRTPAPPHIHLTLSRPDGTGTFYLNRFDEETLLSLDKTYCGNKEELDCDRIIVMEQDRPIQASLF